MEDKDLVARTFSDETIHKVWRDEYRTDEADRVVEMYFDSLFEKLAIPKGTVIFDAGCGTAFNAVRMARRGYRVEGVDFSQFAVDEGVKYIESQGLTDMISIRQGDLTALDIEDGKYSAILVNAVLMHIPDFEKAIAELVRILAPGGQLLVTESNRGSPSYLLGRVWWKFFSKANIRVEPHRGYTNVWADRGDAKLLSRKTSMPWLIERFEREGVKFEWRKSAEITELYARFRSPLLKTLCHRINVAWLKLNGPAALAAGNYLAFRKPR